jgi:hypothetical protein
MKKLVFAIAAVAVMASCSNNEVINDGPDNAVRFTSVVGNSTRAVGTTGLIDLAALKLSNDGFAVSTNGLGSGGEMNNLVVKYSASAWNYTGDYFWPVSASQNVAFTAYAPAGTSGVTLTGAGITVSGFVPVTTPANQIDLLYAAPANFNRSGSGASGVALTFNHLLTQVVFAITTDIPAGDSPTIVSIALTIPNGTGAYNGTTWTASANPQTYTVFSSNALSSTAVTSTPLLMIPQTLPVGTNALVTFSVKGVTTSNTVDLSTLSVVKSWTAGTKVTYSISFNNTDLKIKFTDPTISTWTNAADGFIY